MPEYQRRTIIIPDVQWRKLQYVAAHIDSTASDLVRAGIDAILDGYGDLEPILAAAFKMVDAREAARQPSQRDVSPVREVVPA